MRADLPRILGLAHLRLAEIAARPSLDRGTLDIPVTVTGEGSMQTVISQALARLTAEPGLARETLRVVDE